MALVNSIGTQVPDPVVTAKTGVVVKVRPAYVPLKWLIVWKLIKAIGILIVLYLRYWWATVPVTALAYVYLRWNTLGLIVVALAIIGIGNLWWLDGVRPWLRRLIVWPLSGKLRRLVIERRWVNTMRGAGLADHHDGHVTVPRLRRVVSRAYADTLTVRMLAAQIPEDYAKVTERLTHAFRVRHVSVSPGRRLDEVIVTFLRGDPLAKIVHPFPIVAVPDLRALPIAVRENGDIWTLCLLGNHILVIGATNSGKGSVAWSILRALAGGITAGVVQVWAFDPKGGMELAAGRRLFARFLCDKYAEMADALDEAVAVMRERTYRLRGITRQHVPTVAEPLIVILIDELATLTAYLPDKQLRERVKNSTSLIASQGRAVGVHLIVFAQDSRKEAVPNRDLYTVRIGLRMTEAAQVNLALADDAVDRGALCHRIPHHTPGVGYVLVDGQPTAERIRFSYPTDDDNAALAATYGRLGVIEGEIIPPAATPKRRPAPRSRRTPTP